MENSQLGLELPSGTTSYTSEIRPYHGVSLTSRQSVYRAANDRLLDSAIPTAVSTLGSVVILMGHGISHT